MDNFEEEICQHARRLFAEGEIQVLVAPAPGPGNDDPMDPKVRVTHAASGIAVSCSDYPSQTENLAAALIQLRVACDKENGITSP